MKPWHNKSLSLLLFSSLSILAACSGGSDSGNRGDVTPTPPPSGSSGGGSSSGGSSGSGSGGTLLYENFGDEQFVNIDRHDNITLFSPVYKEVTVHNGDDWPSFYYPTCCYFDDSSEAGDGYIDDLADRLGLVSDNGNPALLIHNARFTAAQTLTDQHLSSVDNPKVNSTTGNDFATWGELDLSQPYRISFCVKDSAESGQMQIYVDNNTTGEANSFHGGGGGGSRIFNVAANQLPPGQRVEINVPGDVVVGGEVVDVRPQLVGTSNSFLQFRAANPGVVIIDDLLIEYQDDNGQAGLPECNVFTPATAPEVPDAPSLNAGDARISVSWSATLGVSSYDLAWGTADDVNLATLVEGITGNTYALEELENDTEYFVFLRARNSAGISDWSESASATPEEPAPPVGDACAPTTQVNTSIPWGVYDGCLAPHEDNSVIVNTSEAIAFNFGSSLTERFTAVTNEDGDNLGTSLLDTTEVPNDRSRGEIFDIFETGYPKHFTAIARIKTGNADQRGFELQTYFGDANTRVNMQLRPDEGVTTDDTTGEKSGGRIQLEKFIDNNDELKADFNMLDGEFHIYHIAFTMTDADTLNAKVYVDGNDTPILDQVSTGREDSGNNKLRIGEDSSSAHKAEVDWIVWTTNAAAASLKPSELVDELPEGIGELGSYATNDQHWTGAALDLVGEGGTEPSGSILVNQEDKVTISASGGSVDGGSLRKYFAYREVSGDFTFTARLTSVSTTDGGPFVTTGNSYRFGIAIMESVTPTASGNFVDSGRFATADYYLTDTAPTFQGSRAHKEDISPGSPTNRSRSDIPGLEIGHYLRIQLENDEGTLRVRRFTSADGSEFTQANSTSFKDTSGSHPFPSSWYFGFYGAPGDDLTLVFEDITITQD